MQGIGTHNSDSSSNGLGERERQHGERDEELDDGDAGHFGRERRGASHLERKW